MAQAPDQPTITESVEPTYDANDPRLIAAASVLVEWLLETLSLPEEPTGEGDEAV